MRAENWNPKANDAAIYGEAMDRLEAAANIVKRKAWQYCPIGHITRGVAKKGRFAGKSYTARTPGSLRSTIRVVRKHGDPKHNVWIMAGNKKVFYARIVEYKTPFLRPALMGSKSEIRTVIKQPTMKSGRSFVAKGGTF